MSHGLDSVGRHENGIFTDGERYVHNLVEIFRLDITGIGRLSEALQAGELSAENGLVKTERLFRVPGEIQIGVYCEHI